MQADALKGYTGTPTSGSVNPTPGVYTVSDLPFYSGTVTAIDKLQFETQRYTSKYTFDYFTMYN